MAKVSHKIGAGVMAVVGLGSLSPVQQAGVALSVGAAALWATPALATNTIPGVGTIIKRKPGDSPIFAPADANGETRLTGLEPGEYAVKVFGGREETTLRVGDDGRLAFSAWQDDAPRGRPILPAARRWAAPIAFDGAAANAVVLDMQQQFRVSPPPPCDPLPGRPDTCNRTWRRNHIDVNASSAADIVSLAPSTTPEAAAAIVAERTRGGAFRSYQDFANRVCATTSVNFDDASVKIGDTSITMQRGGEPKANGFRCSPRPGLVEMFGSRVAARIPRFGFRFLF